MCVHIDTAHESVIPEELPARPFFSIHGGTDHCEGNVLERIQPRTSQQACYLAGIN